LTTIACAAFQHNLQTKQAMYAMLQLPNQSIMKISQWQNWLVQKLNFTQMQRDQRLRR
jgi:hypothetical protein